MIFGVVLFDGIFFVIVFKMVIFIEIFFWDMEDEVEILFYFFIKRYFFIEFKNFVFLIR